MELEFWGGQGVIVFNKRGNILRVGISHKKVLVNPGSSQCVS